MSFKFREPTTSEELELLCVGLTHPPVLTNLNLTLLTPYADQMRYDAEFWPDQATAVEAIYETEKIKKAVLDCTPSETYP
jgi:hypothetical protein